MSSSILSRTPQQCIYINTSQGEESRWLIPQKKSRTGPEFIQQLPERTRHAEETAFISDIFHHAAQAHEHLSEVCANVSVLAKVTDKATLLPVINGAVTTGPVEHTRGVPQPGGRQAGQDDRGREMRKGQKDGSTHPKCTLPGP